MGLKASTRYAGTDPLIGREIRFRKTCKSERAAQIKLGKLLAMPEAGAKPERIPQTEAEYEAEIEL